MIEVVDPRLTDLADRLRKEVLDRERRDDEQRAAQVVPDWVPQVLKALNPSKRDVPEVLGCTEDEIGEIAAAQAAVLPTYYIDFLRVMGKGAGNLYGGSEWLYPHLLDVKDYMKEELDRAGSPFELPKGAVVVYSHQGYQFSWMTSTGDRVDPPVWYWVHADGRPTTPRWSSWLDFLLDGEQMLYRYP
ncbi:MAG TPA: SMI1/KNR4 family protein [Homoserinimonas sp.]|nr:SMI1/KNR4 family protein [Homoserinimonas sp.]